MSMIPLEWDAEIEFWTKKLEREMRSLGESLIHFANRLKSDKPPVINGEGEIQRQGQVIDLLCCHVVVLQA